VKDMEVIQNILIVILAGYMTVDQNGPVVLSWFSVIVGMISGLIMGDMNTGLMIGGTFQLMSLGVAALGGASAPNYGLATIIGTFIAVRTGTGVDAAIAVGLPVGLLAIQLEVVVRIHINFISENVKLFL
jgi:PTS system mannose-specific IIC component